MRPSDAKLYQAFLDAGFLDLALRAKEGEFNEFFGKHATPEILLVDLLHERRSDQSLPKPLRLAAHNIRLRIINGDFDAGIEESEEWGRSAEGKAAFRELARGK